MSLPLLVLDFESYFDRDFSLRKMTIPEYVADPRFHPHGLAIRHPDGRCEFRTDVTVALEELKTQYGASLERAVVVVHNAHFDLFVLNKKFDIRPAKFIDTKMLTYHVHGRRHVGGGTDASLKSLAGLYGLPAKGDLDFMCGVLEPNAVQQAQLADYARNDVEITYQLALKLIPEVSNPEIEIPIMMHTIRLFTERSMAVDMQRIQELEQQIKSKTLDWLSKTGATPEQISKDREFARLLEIALARTGRLVPLKPGKRGLIPAIAKKDEAMQAMLEDSDPVVAYLANARVKKKSENQLLKKLETLRRIVTSLGGFLAIVLEYWGAVTGRFTGGGKFNIQNLGKEGFGLEMRKLLAACSGCKLVVGDAAQIEARVLAWCAKQPELLDGFQREADIYSTFASEQVFHCEVRKPGKHEPPEVKAFHDPRRQVGKESILGLGYSMGALKFMNNLRAKPATAKLFVEGVLTPLLCRDIVSAYRSRYPEIPQFWADLDNCFRQAINGIQNTVGPVRFEKRKDTVLIWLPSGRALRYPNARLTTKPRTIRYLDQNGQEAEFMPEGDCIVYGKDITLYGGKICENIVQAIARDVLVEAILHLESEGWKVVFHVHDEIVIECLEEQAESCRAALEAALRRAPAWGQGLPLNSEVNIVDQYTK
ncbi:MAG TPA: DNA polymerase [Verrucomicrobiae bacterium]|nr:DNA polymerase [Verrucomicrobiae bacterium]